jgi:hypothetical protein
MKTSFIREIVGDVMGNLGNLWNCGKKNIKMLPKSSKLNISNKHVYVARPMVKDGSGFGFESAFFANSPVADEFKNQDTIYVQFFGSATAWITGAKIENGQVVKHPKLDRASRVQLKNPKLYSVKKTDTDGTYTEYFLRVDEDWQVEPYADPYRNANLIELATMIGQTV